MTRVSAALNRAVRGVGWYVTSLMGDRAYGNYVAHHRSTHDGQPPLNEREFWKERYREQDLTPGSRCC